MNVTSKHKETFFWFLEELYMGFPSIKSVGKNVNFNEKQWEQKYKISFRYWIIS